MDSDYYELPKLFISFFFCPLITSGISVGSHLIFAIFLSIVTLYFCKNIVMTGIISILIKFIYMSKKLEICSTFNQVSKYINFV